MSKAEEKAQAVYPAWRNGIGDEFNSNSAYYGFIEGYHQAEKDNVLTWEDMRELHIIFAEIDVDIELCKTYIKSETIGYYQEVLKQYKDYKERKKGKG
jgi:hypothetical protein